MSILLHMKYYTPDEVAQHNIAEDCWVSIYDSVYDLTELIAENQNILSAPLIRAAGTSISHWFREDTRDLKTFIDPERNICMAYTPYGRFIHVPSPDPMDNCEIVDKPWWLESVHIIGKVNLHTKCQCDALHV